MVVDTRPNCKCRGKEGSNQACKFKLCLSCCSMITPLCGVYGHKKAKTASSSTEPVSQLAYNPIVEAMKQAAVIWIKYAGGATPGEWRAVKPLHWVKAFPLFC